MGLTPKEAIDLVSLKGGFFVQAPMDPKWVQQGTKFDAF
jgi:hypothetical protein